MLPYRRKSEIYGDTRKDMDHKHESAATVAIPADCISKFHRLQVEKVYEQ